MHHTLLGTAMRAVSFDRAFVPLMGVPVDLVISATFAIGAGLAGAAGTLYAMAYPVIDPYMGIMVGWKAFISAVIGGIGNIRGAMIGAFILGTTEIMVAAFLPSTYRDFVAFTLPARAARRAALRHPRQAPGAEGMTERRWCVRRRCLLAGLALSFAIPALRLVNKYQQMILMYVGINIILAASLNLVNGYMGEFSLGSAGFMAVGAYTASFVTVRLLPAALAPRAAPRRSRLGLPRSPCSPAGSMAALFGLLVAFPSFKTRGDYLALVTLAFLMIVKSAIENLDVIGGPARASSA